MLSAPTLADRHNLMPCGADSTCAAIADAVQLLTRHASCNEFPFDHRNNVRQPFSKLVALTPVAPANPTPLGPPLVVAGKNISCRGFGFFHQQPIPFRHMVMCLPAQPAGRKFGLLLQLKWCRFLHHGWYDSGSEFVRLVPWWGTTPP